MAASGTSPRVAVVTDSTAGLADARLSDDFQIVPLVVQRGGTEFRENVDITAAEVLEALQAGEVLTTSRPSPAEFTRIYAELAASGYESAVSIHISAQLSGTYEAAVAAAKTAPIPVEVVDSQNAGMVLGFGANAAREAIENARGDLTPHQIAHPAATTAIATMERGRVLFTSTLWSSYTAADASDPFPPCWARHWR